MMGNASGVISLKGKWSNVRHIMSGTGTMTMGIANEQTGTMRQLWSIRGVAFAIMG